MMRTAHKGSEVQMSLFMGGTARRKSASLGLSRRAGQRRDEGGVMAGTTLLWAVGHGLDSGARWRMCGSHWRVLS